MWVGGGKNKKKDSWKLQTPLVEYMCAKTHRFTKLSFVTTQRGADTTLKSVAASSIPHLGFLSANHRGPNTELTCL